MDADEFRLNEVGIKEILERLSKDYIFEDIGYIYPKMGNEQALSCPKCRSEIVYNSDYTGIVCSNPSCRTKYDFKVGGIES